MSDSPNHDSDLDRMLSSLRNESPSDEMMRGWRSALGRERGMWATQSPLRAGPKWVWVLSALAFGFIAGVFTVRLTRDEPHKFPATIEIVYAKAE